MKGKKKRKNMFDMVGGALVSELLKLAIAEAKKFLDFKILSEDLVSTMLRIFPTTREMELLQSKATMLKN